MLISIIIPTFNYGHCIKRALDSILIQQDPLLEVIVIDDGSTDNTAAIMQDYLKTSSIKINYITQTNQGSAAARNHGIQVAQGEYYLFLDADDCLLPNALQQFRQALQQHPQADAIFAGHCSIDDHHKIHHYYFDNPLFNDRLKNFAGYIRKQFSIVNGAILLKRHIFSTLSYPEDFRCCEDIVIFAHILALFNCISFSAPVLKIYKHADSLRHNLEHNQNVGLKLVDRIFNPTILPKAFLRYRKEYYARRCLSLFRTFYLAGHYQQAQQFYWQGVKAFPKILLQFSYFKKYLRSLLRK